MSVRLSVRVEKLGSHGDGFSLNLKLQVFKFVEINNFH